MSTASALRFTFVSLAPLALGAGSLIKSYDEVLPGGDGGGGASTSSSTSTSSGGGEGGATTTSSSGGGGSGAAGGGGAGGGGAGGGGGGGITYPLECALETAPPEEVQKTNSLQTGGDLRVYESVHPYVANNPSPRERVVVVRKANDMDGGGREIEIFERDESSGTWVPGLLFDVIAVLDVRYMPAMNSMGALVVTGSIQMGPRDIEVMLWRDSNQHTEQPARYVVDTINTTTVSDVRGRVVETLPNPGFGQVDVLLTKRLTTAGTFVVSHDRFTPGTTATPLTLATYTTALASAPVGLALSADGTMVHAFVGAPNGTTGATQRFSFAANATTAPNNSNPIGDNGTLLRGLARDQTGLQVAAVRLSNDILDLRAGAVPQGDAGSFVVDDLASLVTFPVAQAPQRSISAFAQKTFLGAGIASDQESVSFVASNTGTAAADNFVLAVSPAYHVVSSPRKIGQAVGLIGDTGRHFLFVAERDDGTNAAEVLRRYEGRCIVPE
jgi:hypothetical protein